MLPMLRPQLPDTEQGEDTEKEFQRLAEERDRLEAAIAEAHSHIDQASEYFARYPEYVELEKQLQLLLREIEILNDDRAQETLKNMAAANRIADQKPAERVPIEKQKSYIKKLYKKLCLLTHPDKTKNPVLLELHEVVHRLYSMGDIRGLEELAERINAASSKHRFLRENAREYLRIRIEEYKQICSQLRMNLAFVRTTPGYQLYRIYRGPYPVQNAVHALKTSIRNLQNHISNLKSGF